MSDEIQVEAQVGRFQKNATQTVEGRLTRVRGVPCADIRVFAIGCDGRAVATKAGLSIRREQLPELRALVDALLAACVKRAASDRSARG